MCAPSRECREAELRALQLTHPEQLLALYQKIPAFFNCRTADQKLASFRTMIQCIVNFELAAGKLAQPLRPA